MQLYYFVIYYQIISIPIHFLLQSKDQSTSNLQATISIYNQVVVRGKLLIHFLYFSFIMLLNDYAESMAPIIKKWQIFSLVFIHIFYNIVYKVFCQGWSCKLSSIHLIPLKPFNWWRLSSKEKICIFYVNINGIDSFKYKLKQIHILY